jgi:hypothetical protein
MALFFIEMHQGIVAAPELRVTTSQLASCTFIAGYSPQRGLAGAYHYPADGWSNGTVRAAMKAWWDCLKPEQVTLVFAPTDTEHSHIAIRDEDADAVKRWVVSQGVARPITSHSRAPKMSVSEDGRFVAAEGAQVPGNFLTGEVDLTGWLPGEHAAHGGFTLFDSNNGRVARLEESDARLVY